MANKEVEKFLIDLVNRELEEEYEYQLGSEKDNSYLRDLVIAKRYLLSRGKGIEKFINNIRIQEDINKYVKFEGLE